MLESSFARPAHAAVSPVLAFVLAIGCGAVAANLYYAQPLAALIGTAFGVPTAAAGLVVTRTQIGYGLGLLFLVPLGDVIENRRLVVIATACAGGALLLMAIAQNVVLFMVAALMLGVASTVVQILLPYSAQISPDSVRGRVIGILQRSHGRDRTSPPNRQLHQHGVGLARHLRAIGARHDADGPRLRHGHAAAPAAC